MTPTEQDNELQRKSKQIIGGNMEAENEVFELCKRVYEATGWKNTEDGFFDGGEVMPFTDRIGTYIGASNFRCPLYTSDYLLEKLPVYSEDAEGMLSVTTRQGQERNGWMAYYEDVDGYSVGAEGIGKSPLEALLRLTLKLHEEGLL